MTDQPKPSQSPKKPYHTPTVTQIPQPPNWKHLSFQHRGTTGLQAPQPRPPKSQQK